MWVWGELSNRDVRDLAGSGASGTQNKVNCQMVYTPNSEVVNRPPTGNGGPPSVPLTPKAKLECIRGILERADLTSIQKCTGVGLVVSADKEWTAEVKTADLQRMSSAKDRETVFRATRVLDDKAIIHKASSKGQTGRYNILPPKIIEAVMEAFEELQSGRVKPDGIGSRVPTSNPVGFEPTSPVKPVGFEPTSRVQPDQSRACIVSPSEIVNTLESEEKNPLGSPKSSADLHRLAYERGLKTKQGTVAKSARSASRTKGELDGSQGIEFTNGKLTVMNGAAAMLASDYPGIDLEAVCDRAGPEITKMNYPTADDAMTVLRKWSRIFLDEMRKQLAPSAKTRGQREAEDHRAMLKAQNEQIRKEFGWTEEIVHG